MNPDEIEVEYRRARAQATVAYFHALDMARRQETEALKEYNAAILKAVSARWDALIEVQRREQNEEAGE